MQEGKPTLPTIAVDFGGTPTVCRSPLPLVEWAFNCVAMAQ